VIRILEICDLDEWTRNENVGLLKIKGAKVAIIFGSRSMVLPGDVSLHEYKNVETKQLPNYGSWL
jgi:hypothetical protein